jgi:hypothetical protein
LKFEHMLFIVVLLYGRIIMLFEIYEMLN